MPDPVNLLWPIPGSHVVTVQDATGVEKPAILLDWSEATLLARLLAIPPGTTCSVPQDMCLPCGLREELTAMIALRGPK